MKAHVSKPYPPNNNLSEKTGMDVSGLFSHTDHPNGSIIKSRYLYGRAAENMDSEQLIKLALKCINEARAKGTRQKAYLIEAIELLEEVLK